MNRVDSRGYSLTEVLVASAIMIAIFASSLGTYIFTKQTIDIAIAEYNVMRDANAVVMRIVRGAREGTTSYGLRSASKVTIPSASEIDFESPDGNTRRLYLNGLSLIYVSPTQWPNQQTVCRAPSGSTVTLRFWEPAGLSDHETVGIFFSMSRQVEGISVSGSASTYVNARNVPK